MGIFNRLKILNSLLRDIDGFTEKIDDLAVDGLLGVSNSLAYKVQEIEVHLHSGGRWFEKATSASGETHTADIIGVGSGAFQLDAGNDDWGSWVQILGSSDTPATAGNAFFDPHEILINGTERIATYFIQFARGASGQAGYDAGTYTELVMGSDTNKFKSITKVQTGRAPAGSKVWARCMCPGQNTATLDFFIGIHEYKG